MNPVNNKAIIAALFDCLNARDFDSAAAMMTADCIHHTVGLGGGDRVGPDAWRAMVQSLWAAFPDRVLKVHHLIGEADRVAARLTWSGTHQGEFAHIPATGRAVEVNGISVFAMRDGRIAEQWIEQDILALHQQLGAAPGYSDNWPKV